MIILWWHWLVLGALLAAAEIATAGGFYIIFFGVGAMVVGAVVGLKPDLETWVQLVLFAVLSLTTLALFRRPLLKLLQVNPQMPPIDSLVGEVGTAIESLTPGAVGKVELRGTTWSARNIAESALPPGRRFRVAGVDGLLLLVEPEGAR